MQVPRVYKIFDNLMVGYYMGLELLLRLAVTTFSSKLFTSQRNSRNSEFNPSSTPRVLVQH